MPPEFTPTQDIEQFFNSPILLTTNCFIATALSHVAPIARKAGAFPHWSRSHEEPPTCGMRCDIRKACEGDLCYDFTAVDTFMNRADVQASLGVSPPLKTWESCNMQVNSMFTIDLFKNFNYTIPDLLAAGVRVTIYAGDLDFVCNWIGNKQWIMGLEWPGKAAFGRAFDRPWIGGEDGRYGGLVRAVSGDYSPMPLSFVQVFDAGHVVPMDQPEAASRMLSQFIRNKRFA